MLIYSHSTPDILTALFKTKKQIKDSQYCGLIDDNFPDDVMSLTGDDLIIKEGENTINLDMVLAIAYNSIRTCSTAIQFGKIFIANGANIDTYTLKYYLNGIQTGPFNNCVRDNIQAHFDQIIAEQVAPNTDILINNTFPSDGTLGYINTTEGTRGRVRRPNSNNIDVAFKKTLQNLLLNCLTAPCNYFNYSGSSYGFLSRVDQTINTVTLPDVQKTGAGVPDSYIFTKIPNLFQQMVVGGMYSAIRGAKNLATKFTSLPDTLKGKILDPDTQTYEAHSKASSEIESYIASQLGDCYRIYDFDKRYNPYDYQQNKQKGYPDAAPGNGAPRITTSEESLDIDPIPSKESSFTSNGAGWIGGYFGPVTPEQYATSKYKLQEIVDSTSGRPFSLVNGDIALSSKAQDWVKSSDVNPTDIIYIKVQGEKELRAGRWVGVADDGVDVQFYVDSSIDRSTLASTLYIENILTVLDLESAKIQKPATPEQQAGIDKVRKSVQAETRSRSTTTSKTTRPIDRTPPPLPEDGVFPGLGDLFSTTPE
jgi:hypothetical protein